MKKKILFYLLSLALVAGCNKKEEVVENLPPAPEQTIETPTEDFPMEEMPVEENVEISETIDEETTSIIKEEVEPMDFTFNFIGGDPSEVRETEQTLISVYVGDRLITMPLTYSDLERQSLSVNYSGYTSHSSDIQVAYGLDKDKWITVSDIAGNKIVDVYGVGSESRVISNNDKILAITPSDSFVSVNYFGLATGASNYAEVETKVKELGFDSVKYFSSNSYEYIIGCVNINGNDCQVWFQISTIDENGILENISIVNSSLLETGFAEGYGFKKNPYGSTEEEIMTKDILTFVYKGVTYSYDSTIVDYINNGWQLMDIIKSESGGQTTLKLKKGNVSIEFITSSLYIKKEGSHHNISEETVPVKVVLNEKAMENIEFLGIKGIFSINQVAESPLAKYVTEDKVSNNTGTITATFETFGSAEISILDGYVNGITFNYMR